MTAKQFEAIYDAIGNLEVTQEGYVRWADLANIQREVGEMARLAPAVLSPLISARTALKVGDPKGALIAVRQAIRLVDPDHEIEKKWREASVIKVNDGA